MKKKFFSKQFSYFMRLLFVFTKILVFTDTRVKLPKVRNNFLYEINPLWHCIISKNACFQCIMGNRKKKKIKKFLNSKRIWKNLMQVVLKFFFWVCRWFSSQLFPFFFFFQRTVRNFSGKINFRRAEAVVWRSSVKKVS